MITGLEFHIIYLAKRRNYWLLFYVKVAIIVIKEWYKNCWE